LILFWAHPAAYAAGPGYPLQPKALTGFWFRFYPLRLAIRRRFALGWKIPGQREHGTYRKNGKKNNAPVMTANHHE
jgi:hypothetical protein